MTTTQRVVTVGVALAAMGIAAAGCAAFSGDEESPPAAATPDDGGATDAPGKTDGPVVIGQPGPLAVTVTGAARVQQGGSVKVHVKVERAAVPGDVTVRGESLPEGVSSKELVLPEGKSEGDVEINATASVKQGPVGMATMIARARDGRANGAKLDLFVRGIPGSYDATYATDGTLDLGASSAMTSKAGPTRLAVALTAGLRMFALDGTPDTTFTSSAGGVIGFQPNGGFYKATGFGANLRVLRFLPTGEADTTYGTAGTSDAFGGADWTISDVASLPTGEVVVFGNALQVANTVGTKLDAAGHVDGNFTPLIWMNPVGGESAGRFIVALNDGTFLAGVGGTRGYVWVRHVLADGTPDGAFAGGSGWAAVPLGNTDPGFASLVSMVVDANGITVMGASANVDRHVVARLALDGTFAPGFGEDGSGLFRVIPYPTGARAAGMVVDTTGRPIVASVTVSAGATVLALSRFTAQGKPDTTLTATGVATAPLVATGNLLIRGVTNADAERVLVLFTAGGNAYISRFWM